MGSDTAPNTQAAQSPARCRQFEQLHLIHTSKINYGTDYSSI